MRHKVLPQAFLKGLWSNDSVEHADHARALAIADGVKDLFHLMRVADWDLDWVAGAQRVKAQGCCKVAGHKLLPELPLGVQLIRGPCLEAQSDESKQRRGFFFFFFFFFCQCQHELVMLCA